jgi:hypothetical protein
MGEIEIPHMKEILDDFTKESDGYVCQTNLLTVFFANYNTALLF